MATMSGSSSRMGSLAVRNGESREPSGEYDLTEEKKGKKEEADKKISKVDFGPG